jgi:hypothetical protein
MTVRSRPSLCCRQAGLDIDEAGRGALSPAGDKPEAVRCAGMRAHSLCRRLRSVLGGRRGDSAGFPPFLSDRIDPAAAGLGARPA